MRTGKPIAIIGAGMAGLTAANYLRQKNVPFILYEASDKIAGLAASFTDKDGFSHDFGAHFITNRLAKAVGITSDCIPVKYYGESVWFNDKAYNYPFGLIRIARMSLSWMKSRLNFLKNGKQPASAADWFRKRYGPSLANEVALPLLESWSGSSADRLSAELGKGLFGGGIAKTLYLKTAGLVTGHAVACGYNREKPETPSVWHVYPKNGIATLCEKLAEGLEDSIKLRSPVQEIIVEDEKVVGIKINGEVQEVSAVISTAPVNILAKLVKGSLALAKISKFRYRPMVFVNLRLEGHHLLPDTVVWFPEKEFTFFRLTEATQSMPWLAPEGKTIITADIGCETGDEIWTMDEKQLTELCLQKISTLIPDVHKRLLGSSTLKTGIAYPVFLREYEQERQNFERSTNVENLLSIGRNGEFSHMFMEDVYWRTQKKTDELIKKLYPD